MILRFILCTLCIHLSMFPSSFSSSNRSFCRFAIPLRSQRLLSEAPIHRSEFSGAQASIFPSHPMDASSSISSTPPSSIRAGYDVFISHRGPDVRNSLAYGLYHWLSTADPNISVFLDAAEINPGDGLGPPIEHAIRTASVHVAIFSRHYAESPWCLDELCLMLESGAVVLPVFFDVQPSDLRRIESGVYADAFEMHKRRQRHDSQTVEKWQDALRKVSYVSGLELHQFNGNQGRVLGVLGNAVLQHLAPRKILHVAEYPTGLDEAVEALEKIVLDRREPVKMVGIVGMGGIGKTTLAKEFYNRANSEYPASCFLAQVRETAAKKGLHSLQRMLLEDLFGQHQYGRIKGITQGKQEQDLFRHYKYGRIRNTSQGIEVMKEILKGAKIFIVLDDISHLGQLKNLLVTDVLGSGSLVLIASRDKRVLTACGFSHDSIYEMKDMERKHAQELFCMHAFGQVVPRQGFEELAEHFVTACRGLPLALTVLGAQLRGNEDKEYWASLEGKISRVMKKEIIDILKISYDELDDEQQDIFLDIACFFAGHDKSVAVRMWEASGWSALEALQTLQDRCLVGYDAGGRIQVHDHLRQMGITIAKSISPPIHLRQERQICHNIEPNSINELLTLPSTRGELQPDGTRIFSQQQFPNSFTQRRNSPQSGGIDSYDCEEAASVSQFLVVEEDWLKGKLVRLLWLSLYNCPFKSIPSCFSLDNLRVLEIGARLETLWHPSSQVPVQLRDLHISSTKFRKFPKSIGGLVHLEKLTLHGSIVIKTLPEEFCDLRSLKHLELCGSAQLKYLPIRFGDLTNLQHLDLSLCTKLEWLPGSFGGLIKLQHLCLRGCYSLMVPPQTLGNISTLEHLDFTECKKLEVLPYQVSDQRCLRTLRLGHTRLRELPSSMGNLKDLRELKLNDCPNLASLPESIGLLDSLCRLEIWNSMVSNLPKEIARMRNLEELSIFQCPIREVKFTVPNNLNFCNQNQVSNLKSIVLSATDATIISIAEGVFPRLEILMVDNCEKLILVEELPTTLATVVIKNCKALRKIRWVPYLVNLRRLQITHCPQVEELPSSRSFTSLEEIKVAGCGNLPNIESLDQFERLNL